MIIFLYFLYWTCATIALMYEIRVLCYTRRALAAFNYLKGSTDELKNGPVYLLMLPMFWIFYYAWLIVGVILLPYPYKGNVGIILLISLFPKESVGLVKLDAVISIIILLQLLYSMGKLIMT